MTEVPLALAPALAGWAIGPLRPCEAVLFVLVAMVTIRMLVSWWPHGLARLGLILLFAALAGLHHAFEGWRWQMAPLYAAGVMAVAWLAVPRWSRLAGWIGAGAGFAALFATIMAAVLVPMFRLIPPGGPMAVGTRLYELVDASRPEPQGSGTAPRRLMVQLWYPALAGTGRGAAAYRDAVRDPMLSHLRWIPTDADVGADFDPTPQALPLVLFVHGLGGARTQNTGLMQEMASRGFAVAAFDVSYWAAYEAATASATIPGPKDFPAWLGVATDDAIAVAAGLAGVLGGRVDAARAVIVGSGFGAAVAQHACARDRRFAGVVAIDHGTQPLSCPYLFVGRGQPGAPAPSRGPDDFGGWSLAVAQSGGAFTDGPLFFRVRSMTGTDLASHAKAEQTLRRYTVAFADWALRNGSEQVFAAPAPDGVTIQAVPARRRDG